MSFCMRCGKQNPDGTMFCTGCGFQMNQVQNVPVQNVPMQNIPAQNVPVQNIPAQNVPVQNIPVQNVPMQNIPAQNVPVQNIPAQNVPVQNIPAQNIPVQNIPMQNSPVQQNYAASPAPAAAGAPAPEKKKNKALLWIIIGACCTVAAIVVGIILIATNKKHSGAQGALDDYFAAVNKLDPEAVYACCHTDMSGYTKESSVTTYFAKDYYKSRLSTVDYLRFDRNVYGAFLNSYGYKGDYTNPGVYSEMMDEAMTDSQADNISKTLAGLNVSYKLNRIKDADKCSFAFRNGLQETEVNDVIGWLKERTGENVTDAKFANITVEWKYGDKVYGYDKNWWKDENVKSILQNMGKDYQSYDSAVNMARKDATVDVIVYQVGGKWYVYPEHILRTVAIWKVNY